MYMCKYMCMHLKNIDACIKYIYRFVYNSVQCLQSTPCQQLKQLDA